MSSFHYDFILSKRGTLAKVWLAAHWEKKLSKVQVFETNLQSSVHDILHPVKPIALRTSSHLLVGLVRILSRKAKYLLTDCSETLVNIKITFRPGVQSLEKPRKRKHKLDILDCPLFITEKVDLLDQWIPEQSQVEMDCSLNQSRVEEITLQEEPMKVVDFTPDYFDDEGFGDVPTELDELTDDRASVIDTIFPRVHSFADSAYSTEDGLAESDLFSDFSDPFTITPVKNRLCDNAIEKRLHDAPVLSFDSDDNDETEITSISTTPKQPTLEPCLQIHLLPTTQLRRTTPKPSVLRHMPIKQRKSLKRKLIIDNEISIERSVYFDQVINFDDTMITKPILAPRTKQHMNIMAENPIQFMFKLNSLQMDVARSLTNMCNYDTELFNSDTNRHEGITNEQHGSCLQLDKSLPESSDDINLEEVHSQDSQTEDEDVCMVDCLTIDSPELRFGTTSEVEFDQEADMSHDEFCMFVEKVVADAPTTFTNVIGKDWSRTRKNVAKKFLKCLLMQRDARLHLEQDSHFTEIFLHSGKTRNLNG